MGFPGGSDDKESTCNEGDLGSILGLGRFPWRKAWQPTPIFLSGESYGQRSLAGYSLFIGSQRVRHDWVTKHSRAQKELLAADTQWWAVSLLQELQSVMFHLLLATTVRL